MPSQRRADQQRRHPHYSRGRHGVRRHDLCRRPRHRRVGGAWQRRHRRSTDHRQRRHLRVPRHRCRSEHQAAPRSHAGSGFGRRLAVNDVNAGITLKVLSGAALTLSGATISAGALVETWNSAPSSSAARLPIPARSWPVAPAASSRSRATPSSAVACRGWQRPHLRPLRRHRQHLLLAHRQRRVAYRRRRRQLHRLHRRRLRVRRCQPFEPQAVHRSRQCHFASGAITFSYTLGGRQRNAVVSWGREVAEINLVGSYTSANFHAGRLSAVEITDPQVPNGGVVSMAWRTAPRRTASICRTSALERDRARLSKTRCRRRRRAWRERRPTTPRRSRSRQLYIAEASSLPPTAMAARSSRKGCDRSRSRRCWRSRTPLIGARPPPSAAHQRIPRADPVSCRALVAGTPVGARNLLRCAETMTPITGNVCNASGHDEPWILSSISSGENFGGSKSARRLFPWRTAHHDFAAATLLSGARLIGPTLQEGARSPFVLIPRRSAAAPAQWWSATPPSRRRHQCRHHRRRRHRVTSSTFLSGGMSIAEPYHFRRHQDRRSQHETGERRHGDRGRKHHDARRRYQHAGIISATGNGVLVSAVTAFAGGITNSGSISGRTAIDVAATRCLPEASLTVPAARLRQANSASSFRVSRLSSAASSTGPAAPSPAASDSTRKRQRLQRRHPQ